MNELTTILIIFKATFIHASCNNVCVSTLMMAIKLKYVGDN